jgi:hypothetical protein
MVYYTIIAVTVDIVKIRMIIVGHVRIIVFDAKASNGSFFCYNITIRGNVMNEMDLVGTGHKFKNAIIVFLATFKKNKLLVVLITLLSFTMVFIFIYTIARLTCCCESRVSCDNIRVIRVAIINTNKMGTNPMANMSKDDSLMTILSDLGEVEFYG